MAGRARRSSAQDDLMEGEETLDAIGDMLTGQRSLGDVHDVGADRERIGDGLRTDRAI
jgi:hypothetical protein